MNGKVRAAGSILLLAVLAWVIKWSQLGQALAGVDWRLFLLALIVLIGAQVIGSRRWQILARVHEFGGSLARFVAYYFIGMLFNLILPTSVGGDVVRAWYLAGQEEQKTGRQGDKETGRPGEKSSPCLLNDPADRRLAAFLSVFAERFSGILMLLLLACVSTLCCPVPLPGPVVGCVAAIGSATLLGVFSLPLVVSLAGRTERLPSQGLLGRTIQRVFRLSVVVRVVAMVRQYGRHWGVIGQALALSVLVQAGGVLQFGLLARSMGLPIPWLYLGVVVPLVSLATLLPISINGMGLRVFATAALLRPLGVGTDQTVALSSLSFALVAVLSLTAGLGCYLLGRFPRFQTAEAVSSAMGREKVAHEDPVRGDSDQGRARQPPAAA